MADETLYTQLFQKKIKMVDNGDGTFSPQVAANITGDTSDISSAQDYLDLVNIGRVPGRESGFRFGSGVINNGVEETIASMGGIYQPPPTAQTLSIVSNSPNDTLGGSGANFVFVQGLDGNYDPVLELVQMNGTTPVNTLQQFIAVNQFAINACGASRTNEGQIDLEQSTSAIMLGCIPPSFGVAPQLVYTVRAGYTGLLKASLNNAVKTTGGTAPIVEFILYTYFPTINALFRAFNPYIDTDVENTIRIENEHITPIQPTSTIYFNGLSDQDSTRVFGEFEVYLIENES